MALNPIFCASWNQNIDCDQFPAFDEPEVVVERDVSSLAIEQVQCLNDEKEPQESVGIEITPIQEALPQSEVANHQLLYMSLLQQQISVLQNQLLFSTNSMNLQHHNLNQIQTSIPTDQSSKQPKPQSVSVAVNTSFSLFPQVNIRKVEKKSVETNTTFVDKDCAANPKAKNIDISQLESGLPTRINLPSHVPISTDGGKFVPINCEYSEPDILDCPHEDISFAQSVVERLVNTADQSFMFKDDESDENSRAEVFGNHFKNFKLNRKDGA